METNLVEKKPENLPTQYKAEVNIYSGASTLQITEAEQVKLLASFDENEIEIRPDGLIYLPQTFWRKRLNEAFGIGQWVLIVKNSFKDPNTEKDKLYVEGVLMVRGCYMATAVGEAELHSENPLQSWASVFESAKSDCITRCCKDLSIASELWQPQFIQKWISDNAVKVFCKKKDGKTTVQWRKKTAQPFYNETGLVPNENGTNGTPPKAEQKQQTQTTKQQPVKEKGWLNLWADKSHKDFTKEGANTIGKVAAGTITIAQVEQHYKLSKEVRAYLESKVPSERPAEFLHEDTPF